MKEHIIRKTDGNSLPAETMDISIPSLGEGIDTYTIRKTPMPEFTPVKSPSNVPWYRRFENRKRGKRK